MMSDNSFPDSVKMLSSYKFEKKFWKIMKNSNTKNITVIDVCDMRDYEMIQRLKHFKDYIIRVRKGYSGLGIVVFGIDGIIHELENRKY